MYTHMHMHNRACNGPGQQLLYTLPPHTCCTCMYLAVEHSLTTLQLVELLVECSYNLMYMYNNTQSK